MQILDSNSYLLFTSILVSAFIGAIISFLFYYKSKKYNGNKRYVLASLRFLSIASIVFVIIAPLVYQNIIIEKKPILILALDNSKSTVKYKESILDFGKKISEKATNEQLEIRLLDLNGSKKNIDSITFDVNKTNLSTILDNTKSSYISSELAGMVLISDGIYNSGISPLFQKINYPLYTIGVGDTISPKDIIIKNIFCNKISSKNTKFPILIEIQQKGYKNQKTQVQLFNNNQLLETKEIVFNQSQSISEISFITETQKDGIQEYQIKIKPLENEFSIKNNIKSVFIEVINEKKKILIAAMAPHPDLKAILLALDNDPNIEIVTFIASQNSKLINGKYSLIIAHQIPNKLGIGTNIVNIIQSGIPTLFIAGSQTDYQTLSNINQCANISNRDNQIDKSFAAFNQSFSSFNLSENTIQEFAKYPPLTVPYAQITPKTGTQILLYQKIGTIVTDKALLMLNTQSSNKHGLLLGEGIWQWRIQEMKDKEESSRFDEIIQKSTQLLSSKLDKRKLRVNPINEDNQGISSFGIEVYDDIYEKKYGTNVKIEIKSGDYSQSKTFEYNIANEKISFDGLKEGIYKFTASANIGTKIETVTGSFSISSQNLESNNLKADFEFLRNLAHKNNGDFVALDNANIDQIINKIKSKSPKTILKTSEKISNIIDYWIILPFILLLISIEWFFRKYWGSY